MNIWILIPAYNEEKNLEKVLRELKQKKLLLLVVDDGSYDGTYRVASEYADKVIKNEKNLGKGISLQNGIKYLLENTDFDYVIIMDADGQHSPLDIDGFLSEARERKEPFVVGNRMVNPGSMPALRLATNKFMSWLISMLTGQNICDSQCGFRMIRRDVLEKVRLKTSRFEIESELVIAAAHNGFYLKSIPIRTLYKEKQQSNINPFFDTLRFIKFIFQCLRSKPANPDTKKH